MHFPRLTVSLPFIASVAQLVRYSATPETSTVITMCSALKLSLTRRKMGPSAVEEETIDIGAVQVEMPSVTRSVCESPADVTTSVTSPEFLMDLDRIRCIMADGNMLDTEKRAAIALACRPHIVQGAVTHTPTATSNRVGGVHAGAEESRTPDSDEIQRNPGDDPAAPAPQLVHTAAVVGVGGSTAAPSTEGIQMAEPLSSREVVPDHGARASSAPNAKPSGETAAAATLSGDTAATAPPSSGAAAVVASAVAAAAITTQTTKRPCAPVCNVLMYDSAGQLIAPRPLIQPGNELGSKPLQAHYETETERQETDPEGVCLFSYFTCCSARDCGDALCRTAQCCGQGCECGCKCAGECCTLGCQCCESCCQCLGACLGACH